MSWSQIPNDELPPAASFRRRFEAKTIVVSSRAAADHQVTLTIADDGKGFDPLHSTRGYGLRIMDSRARLVQGTLRVESRLGGPTRIILTLEGDQGDRYDGAVAD